MLTKKFLFSALVILLIFLLPFFNGGRGVFSLSLLLIGCSFAIFLSGKSFGRFEYASQSQLSQEQKRAFRFFQRLSLIFLCSFFFFAFFSCLFSLDKYASFLKFFELLVYSVFFFLIYQNLRISVSFCCFLLGIASIISLIGIYLFLESDIFSRAASLFYNPNVFASWLIFFLPLSFFFFLREKEKKRKILFALCFLLIFLNFILAFSRGAILALGFALIVVFALRFSIEKRIIFWQEMINFSQFKNTLIFFLAAFFFLGFLSFLHFQKLDFSFLERRIKGFFQEENFEIAVGRRINFFQGAWQIFKDQPFLGTGLETFVLAYPQYQKDALSSARYTHNYFLQLLSETGIFGAVCLFLFFICRFVIYWLGRQWSSSNPFNKSLHLIFFISLFASFFHSFFDFSWEFKAVYFLFWVYLGLVKVQN